MQSRRGMQPRQKRDEARGIAVSAKKAEQVVTSPGISASASASASAKAQAFTSVSFE